MQKKLIVLVTMLGLFTIFSSMVFADWIPVAPGIDYSSYTIALPDGYPCRLFVTRMSRASTNCIIDSMLAQGRLNKTGLVNSGMDTVSGMANLYNDTINYWGSITSDSKYWGTRSQVIAAINGDYFSYATDSAPLSAQIQSGWFAKRFYPEYNNGSGFVWKSNRTCFLGGSIRNGEAGYSACVQLAAFGYSTATITKVNTSRSNNQLVIYTPQYGPHTYTNDSGTEVLVQMARPNLPFPTGTSYAKGNVVSVRRGLGSTPIPFDYVVFSGVGSITTLLSQCTVGQEVRVYMHIKDFGTTSAIRLPADQDWGKAYASIGGTVYCVVSSQVPSSDWGDDPTRHPRTAIAFNTSYIYFVVADGRTTNSYGMSYTELGNFCKDTLEAQFATCQDGGGSSTLWVNGEVKNYPSGPPTAGVERVVANGLMMVNVLPMSKSLSFYSYATVTTVASTQVRLGPGTNYNILTTIAWNKVGFLTNHTLNGVYAKGQYWWNVNIEGYTGWVSEGSLALVPIQLIDFEAAVEPKTVDSRQ